MAKFDIKRFLFDINKVEEELITLLSIFHASSNNQSTLQPLFKSGKILGHFVTEENIIQRTLMSTAITLRMIDDRFIYNSKKVRLHHVNVGQLVTQQKTLPLTFREACNKIVHSNELLLNVRQDETDKTDFLDTIITVKGNKREEVWNAAIEIDKYVINGLCLTKYYDEDWEISAR